MSQRDVRTIKKWKRTISFLDGEAPFEHPADSLNAKLHGLTYKPRDGYTEVGVSPSDPFQWLGLNHVINGEGVEEFISVEDRNGTIKAYSIDVDDFTRTQIGSITLAGGNWYTTHFNANAYLINPGGTKTVYKHVIGDGASLTVLEDTDYVGVPDEELTITPTALAERGWDAGDTWTYTSTDGILAGAAFNVSSGTITVTGSDNSNGPYHQTQFQSVLTASQDWTAHRAVAFRVKSLNPGQGTDHDRAGYDIFNSFRRTNVSPEIKTNGTWRVIASTDFKETISSNADEVTIEIYIRGLTDINDVEAVRFTISGTCNRYGSPNVCTIYPIKLGGTYLESTVSTQRLWDGTLVGDGITYGFRYTKAGPLYSGFSQGSITADEGYGFSPSTDTNAAPLGGRITLSVPVATTGAYTDVQFVRLMADGVTWKIISTVANTGFPQFQDIYSEYDLAALTTATGITDDPIQPTPPFSTTGIRFAFPFKQSMIWLTAGGESNVKISRVGDPEEIYDSEVTYDNDDLTQPAERSLADNQADQPVWGVQAGANAFIVGERSAYALVGDFPVSLSPSRQIPGSRGIAGMYAGCRFRPTGGTDGAAYMDEDGNVWLVNSVPEFTDDTRAKPFELSTLVRGKIKQFLYTDQRAEFTSLDIAQTNLQFQEATSSLWCILGRRAAVYRQDEAGSGWEFYEYTLTSPDGTSSACTAFSSNGGVATNVEDGGTDWTLLGYPFASDDSYATSGTMGLGTGKKSDILRCYGFVPDDLIPVSATIDSVTFRVEDSKIGDLTLTQTKVQPRKNGADWGSDLDTARIIDTTDTVTEYEITTSLPTVAQINDGLIGIDLQYSQSDSHADWNDPAKWNIVRTGTTSYSHLTETSHDLPQLLTVTYTGAAPIPSFVNINVTATTTVHPTTYATNEDGSPLYLGIGTADNGIGDVTVQNLYSQTSPAVTTVTATGSEVYQVALTAGVGTKTVPCTASESLNASAAGIDMTATASGTLVPYVTDTARVDNVAVEICYTVTSVGGTTGVSWERVCYTVDSKYLAGRSGGQLDLIEYDFRNESFIDGTDRDGGYQMPDWYLTLQRLTFEGRTARLNGVQLNTLDGTDAFGVADKIGNGSFVDGTSTGISTSRWVRFPVTQIGLSHQIKVSGGEDVEGIDGLAIEYQVTSRSKVK